MTNNSKALKSGIWYTASNLLVRSISIITTPLFTRLLTKTEYGDFQNFLSWQSIAIIVISLNLEASLISAKFDYKDRFKGYISSILSLSTVSVLIWLLIVNVFPSLFSNWLQMKPIYINLMLLYCGFNAAINTFQLAERYTYKYKTSTILALLVAIGTALTSVAMVVLMPDKLFGRVLGSVLPTVIIGAIIYYIIMNNGKQIDTSIWKYALKICLPFVPHLLSLTLLNSIDRVMIKRICGSDANALYSVAYNCGALVTIIMVSFNNAFSPWLGDNLYTGNYSAIRKATKIYIAGFCCLAIGIMLLAPEVLYVMGGEQYAEAKYVMPPVAMGCVCQFLYTLFVNIEQYKKKTVGMAFASMSAAILNIVLNAIFIPLYGYIAAAYTTLAGYLFLLIIHMLLVKRLGYSNAYSYKYIAVTVSIMMAITILINALYSNSIIRVITICSYGALLIVMLIRNRQMVKEFIKRITKKEKVAENNV